MGRCILVLFCAFAALFTGCEIGADTEKIKIAKVNDHYLYEDDIYAILPIGLSPEDSTDFTQRFIQKWVTERLLLDLAELNLPDKMLSIEKKVDAYKNSLIIFEYEKELIKQKMDTIVSEAELKTYYESNKENFELKDYIIKVNYVKLDDNAPRQDKAYRWFDSDDQEHFKKLDEYCHQFAKTFYFDEDQWIFLDDFLQEIPSVDVKDKMSFLKQSFPLRIQNDGEVLFIDIYDFKLKDGVSPMELEKERIRKIILNKRKLEFMESSRYDIYNQAITKGNVEVYKS